MYIHKDAILAKMVTSMQTGFSHMAVVLKTASAAQELRDIAEDFFREVSSSAITESQMEETVEAEEIVSEEREVVGILTLENVIERIL